MTARGAALPADDFRRGETQDPVAMPHVAREQAEPADAELLRRAQAGDRLAFGRLVERHHRSLASILRQKAGPRAPLEDLVQEVFARSLAHLDGFRSDASFLTWATSIGLHLAADWRRKDERRRRLAPPGDVEQDAVACPRSDVAGRQAEDRDEVRRAREAMDALPDGARLAITLRVVEDLPYEEVARRLDVPVARVRQWVCRGLRRMREVLEVPRDAS